MQTEINDQVVLLINAPYLLAYPLIPITYPNQPFDYNSPPDTYIKVLVEVFDAEQIGMSSTPKDRSSGYVYIQAYTREGKGSRHISLMLDWFAEHLKYRNSGILRLKTPKPTGSVSIKGWFSKEIKIPFYADEV